MKFLRRLNLFAIGLPFLIAAIEMVFADGPFFAIISTMLTGFLQVFIAFALVADHHVGNNLRAYLILTTLFFLILWLTDYEYIWYLPPFLAVYLTIILYLDYTNTFLKAQWRKLLLINYEVNPELLLPYLPTGTELDLYNGKCYVSLVGFLFQDTRVCGMKIPNHINFEEVNIRFYVTRKEGTTIKRGVVFIKEIVPKRAIATIANLLYSEHYETLPMRHSIGTTADLPTVAYGWLKNRKWNTISASYNAATLEILPETEADFITEHYFGYTKVGANTTFEYEVTHPKWQQYEVNDYQIDVDFIDSYGEKFAFLGALKPTSVILAEGSDITVKNKVVIQN